MKTIEELKAFYNGELMADIQRLENQRKDSCSKVIRNSVIVLGVALVFVFFVLSTISFDSDFFFYFIFTVMGGIGMVYWFGTRAYTSEFKQQIIARLVEFIDPALNYDKDSCISQALYAQSKLFTQGVDSYQGDDLVLGRIGQTEIQFSELHTQYITRDSKGRSTHHTIFKGLFFAADFNKHFQGRTIVLPDTAEKLLGGLGKFLQSQNFSRGQLVKMDDPEFEKEFVVYGTDQIEARYILTSSLMERILNFQKKTKNKIHLSFVNSKVFIAISFAKNLFEPKIFETLLNFAPIEEYFNDLSVAIGIVEDLNLNLRIWTKE